MIDTDRPKIFEYIINRFGKEKTARVAAYTTLVDKGTIDEIGRAFMYRWNESHGRKYDDKSKDNPWNYDQINKIKKLYLSKPEEARTRYKEFFECFDGLIGTKVAQSVHPAGIVISPITLADNYGVFDKDGELCLFADMDDVHECGLVKFDFLILKNIKIIKDTCDYAGIQYPKMHEINWNDQNVYHDIIKSPVGIFQFEGDFAYQLLRQFKPQSVFDITIVTACLRPSGASYRNDLIARIPHHNPSKLIDELLSDNNGYLVYQEDIIKFLQIVCGLTGSEADTVRRGIARKKPEILEKSLPRILDGYCDKSDHSREIAEQEAREFLQIIEDASSYMFGYNHAIGYSLISYLCSWLRCYYPLEFITAYLNNAANNQDVEAGSLLAKEYKIQIIPPKFGESTDVYYFDKQNNVITKGVGSIRDMNNQVSRDLYALSKERRTDSFIDLLQLIDSKTSLRSNQLDHLIKIDYFSDYGNIPTLTRILKFYNYMKQGTVQSVSKSKLTKDVESLIARFGNDRGANGKILQSYKITDMSGLLHEAEKMIRSLNLEDVNIKVKIKNSIDLLGYVGIRTNNPEDRFRLIIGNVWPQKSKITGEIWGYRVQAQSIGSGKSAVLTIRNNLFNRKPIEKGDIIRHELYDIDQNDKGYWCLYGYNKEV